MEEAGEGVRATTDRPVTVRFPEFRVTSYLRWLAWLNQLRAALLGDPGLEAIARANGVRAVDPDDQALAAEIGGAVSTAAAEAIEVGRDTIAPEITAPLRLWSESLSGAERRTAWLERLPGSSVAALPEPSAETLEVRAQVLEAIRAEFRTRSAG